MVSFSKGRALLALERYDDAYREFETYLQGVEGMRRRDPNYSSALFDASNAHQWVGDALRLQHKVTEAEKEYRESLQLAIKAIQLNPPSNQAAKKIMAMAYYRIGLTKN